MKLINLNDNHPSIVIEEFNLANLMHHSHLLTASMQSVSDTPKWVNKKPKKRQSIFLEVEVTQSLITGLIDKENISKFDPKAHQLGSFHSKEHQHSRNRTQKLCGKINTQFNQIQNISRFFQKAFDEHPSTLEKKPITLPEQNASQDELSGSQEDEEVEYRQIVNKFLHSRPSEDVSRMAYFENSEIVQGRRKAIQNQIHTTLEAKKRQRLFEGGYYTDKNEY